MRIVFLIVFITVSIYAQYEQGKIDMHGGKDDYSYKNRGFSNSSKGIILRGNMMKGRSSDQNRSKANPVKK